MEFTEEDATAFARLCEGKKAQVRETRRLLEKRSQRLLEKKRLLQCDIDMFKNDLAAVGIEDYMTGVAHVCMCVCTPPLCPAIWSMLPVELVQCVFACLPVIDIIRLRVLSKTWDRYVTGVTPGFTKLCAKRNPNKFALISERNINNDDLGPMAIKLYDRKENKSYQCVHESKALVFGETVFVGDGGLVCLVRKTIGPLQTIVFNPLTRQWRELQSFSFVSRTEPLTVLLDRESKGYKVCVMGPKKPNEPNGSLVARIFGSAKIE